MRVLVVDDDQTLGPVLVRGMATDAIAADLVGSGREALVRATATDYAVIVLEATLPDADGFDVCRMIRSERVSAPIIMLSARDSVDDRVHGLDSGADDYLAKPFSLRELLARMRAMSRRGPIRRGVVLEALMREPGTVLSRFDLLEEAWGYHYESRSNVVEVYVRYLREKIDRPFHRHSLQTVRGVGYRICGEH